jgi:hypothetical protein
VIGFPGLLLYPHLPLLPFSSSFPSDFHFHTYAAGGVTKILSARGGSYGASEERWCGLHYYVGETARS